MEKESGFVQTLTVLKVDDDGWVWLVIIEDGRGIEVNFVPCGY